ncbi:MAG: hypothetical protein GYA02_02750 [Clostridiaceae bacterium]|nr:hypothetical protein [Clostridiaceae bacterium]
MRISDLLISGVHISEDNYHYTGQFTLSDGNKTLDVDIAELNDEKTVNLIKENFNLAESVEEIRKSLIDRLVLKAGISSKNVQGEDYFENKAGPATNTTDGLSRA